MKVLLDLLFPPRCVGCARRGSWLCPACLRQLPRLPTERCRRCAQPWPGGAACLDCWSDPPPFATIAAAFPFEGTIRTAIHQLKYRKARHLARPLARAGLAVLTSLPSVDLLVPIPLHPARLAERGYNQSTLIAQVFAEHLAVPVVADALVRVRDTPAQVTVPAAQRRANVQGAFAVGRADVRGARVGLVDDVATTTSTLRAAALALRRAGAARVDALVVARGGPTTPAGNGTIVASLPR